MASQSALAALRRLVRGAALLTILIATVCLMGWALRSPVLTSLYRLLPSMMPVTALGLLLTAMTVWLLSDATISPRARSAAMLSAVVLLGLAILGGLESLLGLDLQVHNLFIFTPLPVPFPSQKTILTSPLTMLDLGLLATALLLQATRRAPRLAQLLALPVLAIALLVILGYLFGESNLTGPGQMAPMALNTALSLMLLAGATLAVRPEQGFVALLLRRDLGGQAARRLLPAALLVPLLVSYLRWQGQVLGWYDTVVGLAIMVLSMIVVLAAIAHRQATKLSELDQQRQAALGELAEKTRLLESVLDSINEGVALADGLGNLIGLNPAGRGLLGPNAECDLGHGSESYGLFAGPEGTPLARADQPLLRAANGEILHDVEMYCRHAANPAGRYLEVTAGPLRDGHGERAGGVAIFRDVTQRKLDAQTLARQMTELARSNAELEQFAYVASHDLQEPLRMVASYTQLLAQRYQGRLDADADVFIAFAVDGATRMQTLINDLLAFSRVQSRAQRFVPVPLEQSLVQALANLQASIQESGAIVSHDPLPTLPVDAGQMVQLWQNLIGNAVKFRSQDPPRVHIAASSGPGGWAFSVRDNGIGIDPKYFSRLFVIFQRLHTKAEYPGNGIGLALCKKIVERHDGRIWLEAQAGPGACFHFTLGSQESLPHDS